MRWKVSRMGCSKDFWTSVDSFFSLGMCLKNYFFMDYEEVLCFDKLNYINEIQKTFKLFLYSVEWNYSYAFYRPFENQSEFYKCSDYFLFLTTYARPNRAGARFQKERCQLSWNLNLIISDRNVLIKIASKFIKKQKFIFLIISFHERTYCIGRLRPGFSTKLLKCQQTNNAKGRL